MEDTLIAGDVVLIKKTHNKKKFIRTDIKKPHGTGSKILVIKKQNNNPNEFYIKRCIGYPGDTLLIRNNEVFINGSRHYLSKSSIYVYKASSDREKLLFSLADSCDFKLTRFSSGNYNIYTTQEIMDSLIHHGVVFSVKKINRNSSLDTNSLDLSSGLVIPKIGDQVSDFSRIEYGHFFNENENEIDHDKVQNNYYFMLGDNRSISIDSRTWGVVPESLIVGKAIAILFSYDKFSSGLKKIRFDRILNVVH